MKSIRRTSGFTLIELLVVIAIIAILAAILFPIFSQAKEKGRQMKCLGNVKQLSTAMTLYADNSNGCLPNCRGMYAGGNPRRTWAGSYGTGQRVQVELGQLFRYTKNTALYECPSDKNIKASAIVAPYNAKYPLSYSMNYMLTSKNPSTFARQKDILLLIHERRTNAAHPSRAINDGDYKWDDPVDRPTDTHTGGSTIVFIDGHATMQPASRLIKEITNRTWDPTR